MAAASHSTAMETVSDDCTNRPASTATTQTTDTLAQPITCSSSSGMLAASSDDHLPMQQQQLDELAGLHRFSASDLEGYLTHRDTVTSSLTMIELLQLLSAGYDRSRQEASERQQELVALHGQLIRQRERIWQLERTVAQLQRPPSRSRTTQPISPPLSSAAAGSVAAVATTAIATTTTGKRLSNTTTVDSDYIDPLHGIGSDIGGVGSSAMTISSVGGSEVDDDGDGDDDDEEDEEDRVDGDGKTLQRPLLPGAFARPGTLQRRGTSEETGEFRLFLDTAERRLQPRRTRRSRKRSSVHSHSTSLRHADRDPLAALHPDSDMDGDDTTWFSCGSPATSGDEQSVLSVAMAMSGSVSSGMLPRRPYSSIETTTLKSKRYHAYGPNATLRPLTATTSTLATQLPSTARSDQSTKLVDESMHTTPAPPTLRSSLERWTSGLLWNWRNSSAGETVRCEHGGGRPVSISGESCTSETVGPGELIAHVHSSSEDSCPLPPGMNNSLRSRLSQEPLLTTLRESEEDALRPGITPAAAHAYIASPTRTHSPAQDRSIRVASVASSPQSLTNSLFSTTTAAIGTHQLAIPGRWTYSQATTTRSGSTLVDMSPEVRISRASSDLISNDHSQSIPIPSSAAPLDATIVLSASPSSIVPSELTRENSQSSTHAPHVHPHGVPLHFKALAIAAKLISGGQQSSSELFSSSKRGIARWTVGLLSQTPFSGTSLGVGEGQIHAPRRSSASSAPGRYHTVIGLTPTTDDTTITCTGSGDGTLAERRSSTSSATTAAATVDPPRRRHTQSSMMAGDSSTHQRTPPTALPLLSSASSTSLHSNYEAAGAAIATVSTATATAAGTTLGSSSNSSGSPARAVFTVVHPTAATSLTMDLSQLQSPPHSPTVTRASSSGTVSASRLSNSHHHHNNNSSSSSSNTHHAQNQNGNHSGNSGARGLLVQLAEQHDCIQDAIAERWLNFAYATADLTGPSTTIGPGDNKATLSVADASDVSPNAPLKRAPVASDQASNEAPKTPSTAQPSPTSLLSTAAAAAPYTSGSSSTVKYVGPPSASALFASTPATPIQQHLASVMSIPDGTLARRVHGFGKKERKILRRLVRAGVPAQLRPQVWLECSGAYEMRKPGYYQSLLDRQTDQPAAHLDQIEMDMHRTMPDNIFFGGDGPGVHKLRRVLVAYSAHNPDIGYCQGMNVMAATLLLVFPTAEEHAFWTLVYLLDRIIPDGYHSDQLMVAQADQRVLEELCRDIAPQLAGHLRACSIDIAAVTISWYLSIFAESMPLESLLRVWDVVLVEGVLALVRISLALLLMYEAELLKLHSTAALYAYLKSIPERTRRPERLLQLAFGRLKLAIRDTDVHARRARHLQALREEFAYLSMPPPPPAAGTAPSNTTTTTATDPA